MKTLKILTLVPTTLIMSLVLNQPSYSQTPVINIDSQMKQDPLVINGTSNGQVRSDCGNITSQPNQIIKIKESLSYLRLTVQGDGKPTMLIDGPGGRFCVLADNYSQNNPELAGFWQSGDYTLKIGNLSPGQHNYQLSISQKNK
ncbi:MAG: hypothetical protein EAZ76_04390 [Nostocales cyanobacterium]|nr:MAG: hypothetical protein EAZ87_23835 [Nostocales cyanobacterium]TAF18769.1 MAG: hypothetical protein EAZ76_04390 [Nostocales cyanobacterium]